MNRFLSSQGCAITMLACTTLNQSWAQDNLNYVTANDSLATLPEQMTLYYEGLYQKQQLPVRWMRDNVGLEVRHILYAVGLLRSDGQSEGIPSSLDRILCKLNPHVCLINQSGNTRWRNKKNSQLCIPSIRWIDAMSITTTRQYPDQSLDWLEATYGTCSLLGERCNSTIDELYKARNVDGAMEVPVLAQAAINFEQTPITKCAIANDSGDLTDQLSDKGREYLHRRLDTTLWPEQPSNKSVLVQLTHHEEAIEVTKVKHTKLAMVENSSNKVAQVTLEMQQQSSKNLLPMIEVIQESSKSDLSIAPLSHSATPSFSEILSPPFISEALVDSSLDFQSASSLNEAQSAVMIFDFPFQECHPLIRHAISNAKCSSDTAIPTSYGVLADARPQKKHHGTHVSGLVVGAHGIGVYPTLKLFFQSLINEGESDKTFFDNSTEQMISNALSHRSHSVRVANFSIDLNLAREPAINQKLENRISNATGVLFVAAAGDDPGSLDGVCEIVPACLKAGNNLLVVGGAKKSAAGSWNIHEQSRYGLRVDILAPSDKILSASADHGSLVRLTGTSQATAIVSGVAARLFDTPAPLHTPSWSPAQVKNRLKATTKIFPTLNQKTASGVLNARQALDVGKQRLLYKDDKNGKFVEVYGQLVGLIDTNGEEVNGFIPMTASGLSHSDVSFCLMYRYHREENGEVTFFYEFVGPNSPTRWMQMDIYKQGSLQITSKLLLFRPNHPDYPPGTELKIPVSKVYDFVDKFSGERACSSPKSS